MYKLLLITNITFFLPEADQYSGSYHLIVNDETTMYVHRRLHDVKFKFLESKSSLKFLVRIRL